LAASQRDSEEQVVVVDHAITVVIERCKVLDVLDAALLKDPESELGVDALKLAAEPDAVSTANERGAVGDLEARLERFLWHSKRVAVHDAGERLLWRGCHRQRLVEECADAAAQRVDEVAARGGRPGPEDSVVAIHAVLSLGRRADGALDGTRGRVGGPFAGI